MQVGYRALRMSGRLEDRPLVVGQHLEPGLKIGRMVGPRLELRCDAEIGAKEATAQFSDQLLASALALVLGIARQVPPDTGLGRSPMGFMPISA